MKPLDKEHKLDPKSKHEIPAEKQERIGWNFGLQFWVASLGYVPLKHMAIRHWNHAKAEYYKRAKVRQAQREGGREAAQQNVEQGKETDREIETAYHYFKKSGAPSWGIAGRIARKLNPGNPMSSQHVNRVLKKLNLK